MVIYKADTYDIIYNMYIFTHVMTWLMYLHVFETVHLWVCTEYP